MKETLERLLPKLNLSLTSAQLDTLARFGSLLLEKNQVMNLTAITEPQKVAELHFYDCLALLNAADFRSKRVVHKRGFFPFELRKLFAWFISSQ